MILYTTAINNKNTIIKIATPYIALVWRLAIALIVAAILVRQLRDISHTSFLKFSSVPYVS